MFYFAFVPVIAMVIMSVVGGPVTRSRSRRSSQLNKRDGKQWKLDITYGPDNFFDEWSFYDGPDPTHGTVSFQDEAAAKSQGLAYVQGDSVILGVDDTTKLPVGQPRKSVRLSTNKVFNGGLFIADFKKLPFGCSVWPAYWSVGPNWPSAGEIDIIEGVNNANGNQVTLHTSGGCSRDTELETLAHAVGSDNCQSTGSDNSGCAFQDPNPNSYGQGFNDAGGGVYVHRWDETGIAVWYFARNAVPEDITSGNPNPDSWSTPTAFFSSATCSMADHFYQHQLTLDITVCGDWAGAAFGSSGCGGTCAQAAANPDNFHNAKFEISSITAYK